MAAQKIYLTLIIGQVWNGSSYTYVNWRFATKGGTYNGDFYDGRIKDLPILKVTPTDGGILPFNTGASIGDMSLINTDFALNTIIDYGTYRGTFYYVTDVQPDVLNYLFDYTVEKIAETTQEIVLQLKTQAESLQDAFLLDTYAGTNVLPAGLEGTDDIIGNVKPKVYGKCVNISPVLVNESLLIYQASSLSNCVITAVYDDGVRLQDYQVNATAAYQATSIDVAKGHGGIPTGTIIAFRNHSYTYTVTAGFSSGATGTITIRNNYDNGGLNQAVGKGEGVTIVNGFASTSALQAYNYSVSGKQIVGTKTIPLITGSGTISNGATIHFSGHNAVYTVATGISSPGSITLTKGLSVEVQDGELVHIVGSTAPWLWGSYQGYFRLTGKPKGHITCDAISINTNNVVHKAGDLIKEFVTVSAISVNPLDAGTISTLNAGLNYLSVYIDEPITYIELIDKVCRSIGAYFYIGFNQCRAGLISVPAGSPSYSSNTISDYQIIDIHRNSIALGDNGIPIYKILMDHSRIETVQQTVAGSVSNTRRNYLKRQYRQKIVVDNDVKGTHAASKQLNIESMLWREAEATVVLNRLLPLLKTRRDYITVTIYETEFNYAWCYSIGETFRITTPRLGYGSGRLMVFAEYEIDLSNNVVRMGFYG